jgi:hypothetical protein
MLKRASQTKRLSGRAHKTLETKTAPIMSTPPMVGVPFFPPCNSAKWRTSSAVRMGWPTLSEINFRITKFPKIRESMKAVIAAATARKVT